MLILVIETIINTFIVVAVKTMTRACGSTKNSHTTGSAYV